MNYEGIVYRPPSEARSLIFQITIGCAHNNCTFCTMYRGKQFSIRNMDDIRMDFEEMASLYANQRLRIFLADGDAVIIPTDKLLTILEWIKELFPYAQRVTAYGAPRDVLYKSIDELKELNAAGLDMVYMGAESGDDNVLEYINKDATSNEIVSAALKLKEAGIKTSITLISGLGGYEFLESHAVKSAQLISKIKPEYVGFLTLMIDKDARIYKDIKEGRLKLLSPEDVAYEMELFLKNIDSDGTIFRANHASNYISLKGTLNADIDKMLSQIEKIKNNNSYKSEYLRGL